MARERAKSSRPTGPVAAYTAGLAHGAGHADPGTTGRYGGRVPADEFHAYADARAGRRLFRDGFLRRTEEVRRGLLAAFPGGRFRLLDIGTADGRMLEALAREFPEASLEGLEALPDLVEQARGRGLRVAQARVEALPFADRTFDAVTMISTLKHVPEAAAALAECRRVLRPGGSLWVGDPTPWGIRLGLWRGHFDRRWLANVWSLKETAAHLARAGFEVRGQQRYMPAPVEIWGSRLYEGVARRVGLSRWFMQQLVHARRPLAG